MVALTAVAPNLLLLVAGVKGNNTVVASSGMLQRLV